MSIRCRCWAMLVSVSCCSIAWSAPRIHELSVRGLRIGAATRLVVTGEDLGAEPFAWLPFPIERQAVVGEAQPGRVELEITLPRTTPVGVFPFHVAGARGISEPAAVSVDFLPQMDFLEAVESLPVALHGSLAGGQISRTRFTAKQGQAIVIDVEARRLGSQLKPVVRLLDEQGRQLAWSGGQRHLGGDARLRHVLPADGAYQVELHDVLYRAAAPSYFRLKIGELELVDFAFPLAVRRGETAPLTLLPRGAAEARTALADADRPGELGFARMLGIETLIGPAPPVILSDHPELLEPAASDGKPAELPTFPVGVSGALNLPGEEDRYVLPVSAGANLRIELAAAQLGSPLDGVVTALREDGQPLASNDDRTGSADPGLDVTIPAGMNRMVVAVRDVSRRGGEQFVYRLVVRPVPLADFRLSVDRQTANVAELASQLFEVQVDRAGHAGPIELQVQGLPAAASVSGATIPAGRTKGLLAISTTVVEPAATSITIVGRAVGSSDAPARVARAPASPTTEYQPWQRDQVTLGTARPGAIGVTWTNALPDTMPLGGTVVLPFALVRRTAPPGPVRVSLVTSQVAPKKTVKENNQDKQVDDVERTLRAAAEVLTPAKKSLDSITLIVPADLDGEPWLVALQAELLGEDGKTVIAAATTTVHSLRPAPPVAAAPPLQ